MTHSPINDAGTGTMGYQICTRCVMDTTDSLIAFDGAGLCDHCRNVASSPRSRRTANEKQRLLHAALERIRDRGQGREFDCLLGLSGGIDSSYLALQAHRFGLRPLVVHVDTGWNSELAVRNIENLVRRFRFELMTEVIDWDEMRDLQCAFLRAGVPNQDIPQDHAISATLHRIAVQEKIATLLDGNNWTSESILPRSWGYDNLDAAHILAIHARFGERSLDSFPLLPLSEYARLAWGFPEPAYDRVSLLDFLDYDRERALAELAEAADFRPYDGKHGESRFTRFFQGHILFHRFGYDKRRAHLSSLIMSGQIDREEALARLRKPPFDEDIERIEKAFVTKKLGFTEAELDGLLAQPLRHHADYANSAGALQGYATLLQEADRLRADVAKGLKIADIRVGLHSPLSDFPLIDHNAPIVLYGTGQFGRRVLGGLRRAGCTNVVGFIDSSRDGSLDDLPIWSLATYQAQQHRADHQILVCSQHAAEIAGHLNAAGIRNFHRLDLPPAGH